MADTLAGPARADIELGELGRSDELSWSPPPRRGRRRSHPSMSLCLALVLAFTLVGSVAKPALTPVTSLTVDPAGFAIAGDSVYAVSGNDLAAYGAGGQPVRWRMESPHPYRDVTTVGDSVVVSGGDCPGIVDSMVTALDSRGVTRWRGPGRLMGGVAGGVAGRDWIIVERALGGQRCSNSSPSNLTPARIEAVDLRDGRVRWGFDRTSKTAVYGVSDRNGLLTGVVTVSVDGTAQMRGIDEGRIRATGSLPGLRLSSGRSLFGSQLIATGDTLVMADGRTAELTGFDLDTLEPRWHQTTPPGRRAFPLNYFACGGVICVWTPAELGGGFVPGTAGSRSRIRPGLSNQVLLLLDPADGSVLRQLHGYQLLATAGGELLLTWPIDMPTGTGTDLTALGWLEPHGGHVRLLATSPDRYQTCAVNAGRLACTTAAGALRVWRTDM